METLRLVLDLLISRRWHPIRNIDYVLEDVTMQLGTKVTLKTRLCTKEA